MDFGAGAGGPPQIPALQCASPEQLIGALLDGRSDVYGCGCLLWQMLTGRPLFDADSPAALATQHLSAITAGLSGAAQVPAELVDIVRKATRITPLDRYQTATEMRIAVRAAMSRQIVARGRREHEHGWSRRYRRPGATADSDVQGDWRRQPSRHHRCCNHSCCSHRTWWPAWRIHRSQIPPIFRARPAGGGGCSPQPVHVPSSVLRRSPALC